MCVILVSMFKGLWRGFLWMWYLQMILNQMVEMWSCKIMTWTWFPSGFWSGQCCLQLTHLLNKSKQSWGFNAMNWEDHVPREAPQHPREPSLQNYHRCGYGQWEIGDPWGKCVENLAIQEQASNQNPHDTASKAKSATCTALILQCGMVKCVSTFGDIKRLQ